MSDGTTAPLALTTNTGSRTDMYRLFERRFPPMPVIVPGDVQCVDEAEWDDVITEIRNEIKVAAAQNQVAAEGIDPYQFDRWLGEVRADKAMQQARAAA